MKFDCGPTARERRIARDAKWKAKRERLAEWHSYFCWLPVRMTGTRDCRWLEQVQRKGHFWPKYPCGDHPDFWTWEFKP